MRLAYDRQTRTLYEADTGHALADLRDDLPADVVHALGNLLAALATDHFRKVESARA
jgi:hypothetical protein